MKKFELKNYIRENIISTLSEDTEAEIAKTKELTSAIKDLEVAKKEAGIEEANIGLDDLQDIGYDDGEYAFDKHFNKSQLNNRLDTKYYTRGFVQAINDRAESLRLNENATPRGEDFTYDYEDIGQFYLEGFGKEHTLNNDQLKMLGKKITDNLYGGDIGKAYDAVVNPHKNPYDIKENANVGLAEIEEMGYNAADEVFTIIRKSYLNSQIDFRYFQKGLMRGLSDIASSMGLNENEEEVFNPDAKVKKTKGLAKAKEELALLTREMKSLAKKYSKAEGEEKEKLVKILKDKTKLKKELESILDNKKI